MLSSQTGRAVTGATLITGADPELYRRLIQGVTDYAIFGLDPGGHVVSWNAGAQHLKGYAPDEIIGRHFSAFYGPDDVAAGRPHSLLRAAEVEGHAVDEGWRVRKDGTRFWASVVITPIRSDEGRLLGFSKITRDLTERRRAEEALRRSEERFRVLVEGVKDYAIFMLDPTGRVASWNAGGRRLKGYEPEEIIGQHFSTFYPPERVAEGWPEHELEVATRDGRFEDEGWRVRKDGTQFWANVVVTALRDANGALLGFAKVTRDLTARREAEEQARRLAAEQAAHDETIQLNERLEALNIELESALDEARQARDDAHQARERTEAAYRDLDQFAYVASHDLKAPLRGIANLAQWIQDDVGEAIPAPSREHFRLLLGRVHRLEALIDGILEYSRAGRMRNAPEPVDCGAVVAEVLAMLAPEPGVTVEVQPGLPRVEADRIQFQQVFQNLIGNAVKFSRAYRPDVEVHVSWRDAGDAYEFTVGDNGPGIPAEYQARVWEVFHTLESRDKVEGTGIGLSVVKRLVETRGGRVWLESAPGQGATFGFAWPKSAPQGGAE